MSNILTFPESFVWGTAISGHQTEGNNTKSDWWNWEQNKKQNQVFPLEASNNACDFYNRYEQDFELCKQLNNDAVRLSIEWARIEPEEGKFDLDTIEHYKKILQTAKNKGLLTFVTLHHFTSPQWLANKGGWHNFKAPIYFEKYVQKVAQELDTVIDFYITINEPQVYALMSYIGVYDFKQKSNAMWPPAIKSYPKAGITMFNFVRAHNRAYKKIKSINEHAVVGLVKNLTWWETDPYNAKLHDKLFTGLLNFLGKGFFLEPIKRQLDFIGLNYYFTNRIVNFKRKNPDDYVSDLGWWINPYGLERMLLNLKSYKLPIYITENGLADAQDKYRKNFIKEHLIATHNAISQGVDVRGYFHWSLMDNYEWHQGFWPKFGLVNIQRENDLKRELRNSFHYYAQICKNNSVNIKDEV